MSPYASATNSSLRRRICRGQIIGFGLSIAVLLAISSSVNAAAVIGRPTIGFGGHYLVGRWTPVVVPVTIEHASTIQLELTAVDSDGNEVVYLSEPVALQPAQHLLTGFIKVGRLDGEIGIRLNPGPEVRGVPDRTGWLQKPLKPSAHLIVTVGGPKGFDFDSEGSKQTTVRVFAAQVADLPSNALAYDSVSSLVIAGQGEFSASQAAALRDWVGRGGRVVFSLSHDPAQARRLIQPFSDWFPVRISEQPVTVREFGGLEGYSGKNVRMPWSSTLSIPSIQFDAGETLASSRSDAFLVRAPYGMGVVTVLAMDLTKAPLSDWKSLEPFCERLVGLSSNVSVREKTVSKGTQLSSTGITDLATQVHATQENFENIHRASPWMVMSLLLLLLLLIGPLDYLIVSRILKRPILTWVTFPVLTLVCAWGISSWSIASNGSARHVNQLDIVNVDVATATARGRHFLTLYSPATVQTAVTVQTQPLIKTANPATTDRVIWQGVPEPTFGGMLRETGLEQQARYIQQPEGNLTDLPVMQWSTKSLIAESLQSADGLVECNLRASATGRLLGTITHRLATPIDDWMVVYKNVVYRHLKNKDDIQSLPFPPKTVWQVEQPTVYSRELRPFLTGMNTMATPRFGDKSMTEAFHNQTTYNSLSLDVASIVRILTFHDEIGGENYTGLTNQLLESEDCSELLRLGRAILFGRLSQPVATISDNQAAVQPDRQASFVRLILPVARPTEVLKELRRLVPD